MCCRPWNFRAGGGFSPEASVRPHPRESPGSSRHCGITAGGDPPKHIHWRSWAKTGRPIVKEYQDEFYTRHALVLDTFPDPKRLPGSRDAALFEEAVSVAASLAVLEHGQDSLMDLLFVANKAYQFTAGRGLAQSGQMLEALAAVGPCLEQPFELLQRTVLRQAARICGCICVLLNWDTARQEMVRGLLAENVEPLVFVLLDQRAPQPDPGPLQAMPGRFHPLRMGRIQEDLQRAGSGFAQRPGTSGGHA